MRAGFGLATFVVASVAITSVACENSKLQSPAVPTSSIPATLALAIDSVPVTVAVGESVQLTASVSLLDGSQKSSEAVWTSSNDSIATVDSNGLVKIVGQGGVDITAKANDHQSSIHLRVPFTLTGIVHETQPTEDTPIAGARVEVQGGPDNGVSAITDNAGRFSLEVEAAGFVLRANKDGYDSVSVAISELSREQRLGMLPLAGTITTNFTGGICADPNDSPSRPVAPWVTCTGPVTARRAIRFHRAGTIEVTFNWDYNEDYSAESMWWEVDCGGSRIEQKFEELGYRSKPFAPGVGSLQLPLRLPVTGPGTCEIRASRYHSFKSWVVIPATEYRLSATHPR